MRKRSAEEKQKQLERFLMNVAEAADAALWEYWRGGGGQGKLHFPYAALRQLPLCELAGSEHLAMQAIHFPQV